MILLLDVVTCRKLTLYNKFDKLVDIISEKLLNMSQIDVQGFRRQRTILQIQFETVPQIFFQVYMYMQLKSYSKKEIDELGVAPDQIYLSILFACIHVILECINLFIETIVSSTPFKDYVVCCYNAREFWMPNSKSFKAD